MEKIKNLKAHWVSIFFALLVAGLMVSPELIIRKSLGDKFQGIYMHGSDGELFYLARMNQTYSGRSVWDSPFLFEYRDLPMGLALFTDPILGYPGKWLGIPVQEMNLIYKTIFSGAIFLLIYFFVFRLTSNKWWSITAAIFIMAGYRLATVPGLMDFLTWRQNHSQFLLFSRTVTSQVTWVTFWGFLHLLLSALRKREWKYFIGCGILFGLSFYVQFYLWTFLVTLAGVVMLGALLAKQKEVAGKTAIILGIGSVTALPYLLNILAVMRHEYFNFYSFMVFLFKSREPDISKIGIITAILLFWYLRKSKKRNVDDMLMLALLATTFITTNQQVLTNRLLEVGHYHWFFNIFVYIIILFYLAYRTSLSLDQRLVKSVFVAVAVLSLANGYLIQSSSYTQQSKKSISDQKYTHVFNWLNLNTSSDNVVFSNNDHLSSLIPVYTRNFVYWSSAAPLYMMPPERLETPLYMYLKLYGITPAMLGGESFFHLDPRPKQLELASKYQNVGSMLYIQFRRAYPDGMLERYQHFYKQSWEDNFKRFRLDYITYDRKTSGSWDLEKIKFLKPIQEFGDVVVYENTLP